MPTIRRPREQRFKIPDLIRAAAPCLFALIANVATAQPVPEAMWEELGPPFGGEHVAVYDPVRDRMVVMVARNGLTHEVWAFDPAAFRWTHLVPVGARPAARTHASAIFDPVRDRMIVFGGNENDSSPFFNDTWAFYFSPYPHWTELHPDSAPAERNRHTAIYDPLGDRMIVFGGVEDVDGPTNEIWALSLADPVQWAPLATAGTTPTARHDHTAIYDADHQRMVVFGGSTGGNDTWSLSLSGGTPTWSRIFPIAGPPASRRSHVAVFDSRHHRMVIHGGEPGLSDTWDLSLVPGSEQWSFIAAANAAPSAALEHAGIYDPVRDRLVIHGNDPTGNQVLALSLGGPFAWTRLAPAVAGVPVLGNPSTIQTPCVYDALRHQFVVYAGKELWAMSLDDPSPEWRQLATATTGPDLGGHAMIYDPANDRLVMFGGIEFLVGYKNTIHTLTLGEPRTWGTLTPSGTPPIPRTGASAIHDPVGQRMVVFGGVTVDSGFRRETYGISLSGPASWTPLATAGPQPLPRAHHIAAYDGNRQRMIVHGGASYASVSDQTWVLTLDGGTPTWSMLTPAGLAPAVSRLPGAYDPVRDQFVVITGAGGYDIDAHRLSFSGSPGWSLLPTFGSEPRPEFDGMAALYDPNRDRIVAMTGGGNPWAIQFDLTQFVDAPGGGSVAAGAAPSLRGIWPNPAARTMTVDFTLPAAGAAELAVFDIQGRRVWREASRRAAGRHQVQVTLAASLAPGVYVVRLAQAGRVATLRAAVTR